MRTWEELDGWERSPETLMDTKTDMACACAWLNVAVTALEQSCFHMRAPEMYPFRLKVEDMRGDLKKMVESIIEEQRQVRRHFNRAVGEEPEPDEEETE